MKEALSSLPGVANVQTDVENETATVDVDAEKFDAQQAAEKLAEIGYEGSAVIHPAKAEPDTDDVKTESEAEPTEGT